MLVARKTVIDRGAGVGVVAVDGVEFVPLSLLAEAADEQSQTGDGHPAQPGENRYGPDRGAGATGVVGAETRGGNVYLQFPLQSRDVLLGVPDDLLAEAGGNLGAEVARKPGGFGDGPATEGELYADVVERNTGVPRQVVGDRHHVAVFADAEVDVGDGAGLGV